MNTKTLYTAVFFLAVGGVFVFVQDTIKKNVESPIACTADAMMCPDGSYVGRTGPHCEFSACASGGSVVGSDGSGGADSGQGILPFKSGIEGVVSRGPMCPVMRVGEECPDAPYTTEVMVYRNAPSREVFATVSSDKGGKFSFSLPPGEYVVNARNEGISKTCIDVPVTVGSSAVERISISCDTGIR